MGYYNCILHSAIQASVQCSITVLHCMCTDDTYNIPRVTDCTRELNEWVYSDVRGRDKLFSAQPRELPELVRRFTQDVYMCVYIQSNDDIV